MAPRRPPVLLLLTVAVLVLAILCVNTAQGSGIVEDADEPTPPETRNITGGRDASEPGVGILIGGYIPFSPVCHWPYCPPTHG